MTSRHVIVCYDIVKAKDRNRVIGILEYYTLTRVQYSVFMGTLTETRYAQMAARIQKECTSPTIKVLIIEVCAACMERAIMIHEEIPRNEKPFDVL